MVIVDVALFGVAIFVAAAAVLGIWLRARPDKATAERASRVMHFLFFACLGAPSLVSLVYPGLTHLDPLVGVEPLRLGPGRFAVGALLGIPGLLLMGASNKSLRARGSGANAFRLTQRIVHGDIYQYTRNPMSLGYYLCLVGLALMSGSTALTLFVVLGLIPAHLFFLKFFEERELALRFGDGYTDYKQKVPFLLPRRTVRGQ